MFFGVAVCFLPLNHALCSRKAFPMNNATRRCLIWMLGAFVLLAPQTVLAQDEIKLEPPPEDPKFPIRRQATPEEAVKIFKKRLEAAPKNTENRTKLGFAYLRWARESGNEEHYKHAEAEFLQVLKANPKSASARALLASAYMAQHKFQEALKLSEEVYADNPGATFALATIGDAYLELGRYDEAGEAYVKLKKAAKGPVPEVLARLARLAEFRGETDRALELLNQAVKQEQTSRPHSPELAWYHLRLGEIYFGSGQIEPASKHLETSLELKENSVPALLALGQVRAAQIRYDDACALYEKAVAQKPDFDLIGDLATLYQLAGNKPKAKELEEKAVSLVPEAKKIETEARHLALFLADREIQLDLAVESARKELKVRQDVFAYDVLAWALLKRGESEAAWEAMQKALSIGTKDARMHFHAGLIARNLGRAEEAKKHLARALEINPHFGFTDPDIARKTLAELTPKP